MSELSDLFISKVKNTMMPIGPVPEFWLLYRKFFEEYNDIVSCNLYPFVYITGVII